MTEHRSMIYFRVDPRLVHATLMSGWVPALGLERVIVADAEVAHDGRLRNIYALSCMGQVELLFVPEDRLRHTLSAPGTAERRQMVLFSNLNAVESALDAGVPVDALNIGHMPQAPGRKKLVPAVYLGPSERDAVERLYGRGVRVYVQPLPDDDPHDPLTEELSTSDLQIPEDLREPDLPPDAPETPRIEGQRDELAEAVLEVVNERGLHLRAAHVLATFAGRLEASVEVGRPGEMVNAKSLLGLTTLGAGPGTKLHVSVKGPGAQQALEALRALFAGGFAEGAGKARDG